MNPKHTQLNGPPRTEDAGEQLRPENQRLLAFLEELSAQPDEKGNAWWEEFRELLKRNPVRLGTR